MDALPNECIEHIFGFCCITALVVAKLVCRSWRPGASRRLSYLRPCGNAESDFLKEAAKEGCVNLILWGHSMGAPEIVGVGKYLYKHGHVDAAAALQVLPVRYLISRLGPEFSVNWTYLVCTGRTELLESMDPKYATPGFWVRIGQKGRIPVFEWAARKFPDSARCHMASTLGGCFKRSQLPMICYLSQYVLTCLERYLVIAVQHAQIPVLNHFKSDISVETANRLIDEAATRGHIVVLEWFQDNFPAWNIYNRQMFERIKSTCHVRVAEWFRDNGIDIGVQTYDMIAASCGRIDLLIWLRDQGVSIREMCVGRAAENKHYDVVMWLYEYFDAAGYNIWREIFRTHNTDLLSYLQRNGIVPPESAINLAFSISSPGTKSKAFQTLVWLQSQGYEYTQPTHPNEPDLTCLFGKNFDKDLLLALVLAGCFTIGDAVRAGWSDLGMRLIAHCQSRNCAIPWGDACREAVRRHNWDLMKQFHVLGADVNPSVSLSMIAPINGETTAAAFQRAMPHLKWLTDIPCLVHRGVITGALKADRLDLLAWISINDLRWDNMGEPFKDGVGPNVQFWLDSSQSANDPFREWILKYIIGDSKKRSASNELCGDDKKRKR